MLPRAKVLCRRALALIILGGSAFATAPVSAGGYYVGPDPVAPSVVAVDPYPPVVIMEPVVPVAPPVVAMPPFRGIGSGGPRSRVRLRTACGTGD
jgi:hypothetical protein